MKVQIVTEIKTGADLYNYIDYHNLEDAVPELDYDYESLVFTVK